MPSTQRLYPIPTFSILQLANEDFVVPLVLSYLLAQISFNPILLFSNFYRHIEQEREVFFSLDFCLQV